MVALAGTALASAPVNTVALFTGRMPGPGEVLADAGNARATGFAVPNGGTIDVRSASGKLVRLLSEYQLPQVEINVAYPSRRHLSAKVRAFLDFVLASITGPALSR